MKILSTALLFMMAHSFLIFALGGPEKKVPAYRANESIQVDGILNESVWKNPPIKDFVQRDPSQGNPATELTHAWIVYDESNLYIGARLFESQPDSIDKSIYRKDNMVESDWFFFFVDPYYDRRTGYYFAVNPGGSLLDGTLFNDSWDDDSWDGVWFASTKLDSLGWCLEMKIPFSQLRFNASENMVWGVNFNRDIKRKSENDYFVMVPKDESGFVSHFADLVGLNGIKPKQRIELLPYIVQKAQFLRHEPDDPFYKSNQYNTSIGGDFKLGIGSNLNIDATFNPDFGQVEVDPAVVNLSAFETFYEEKRPFFIEGNTIFWFGYGGSNNNWGFNFSVPELFYSRRIGRPPQGQINGDGYIDFPGETRILGAAKLTGKFDETWSIGALSAVTQRMYAKIQDVTGIHHNKEVEPFTHYGVLRSQKEFNNGKQGLGLIFTTVNRGFKEPTLKSLLSQNAFVSGIDGWTFLDDDETYVLTGSMIGSYTNGSKDYLIKLQKQPYRYFQRPDATYVTMDSNRTFLTGWFSRLMINKQKGNFYLNASLGAISPGFEYNDLGSQWMADRINGHLVLGYRWFEPDEVFRRKSFYIAHYRYYDFEGNNYSNGIYLSGGLQFLNYYGINVNSNINFESYSKTLTRGGPLVINPANYSIVLSGYSDSKEKIIFSPYMMHWKDSYGSYDYTFGIDFEWKPIPQINFTIGPEYSISLEKRQWVGKVSDGFANNTFDFRYLFGELDQNNVSANIRLNWTFTPTMSLQLYLQPFFVVGNYEKFKELIRPKSNEYNIWGDGGSTIIYNRDDDNYNVDPDGNGPIPDFNFNNPDFNFKSFRANIVFRWELLPGSVFYLVWTHDKTNFDNPGKFNFGRDFRNLWRSEANNIFLAKFSYWIDL